MDHTIGLYSHPPKKKVWIWMCLEPELVRAQTFLFKVTKRGKVHKAMRLDFSSCSAITSQATLGTTLKEFTYPMSSLWALVLSPGR